MNITLWVIQFSLLALFISASYVKLTWPVSRLAAMWPWTAQVPVALLRFTGVVDLLGAAGILAPSLFRIKPWLSIGAAAGMVLLMILAGIFHIARGEAPAIWFNIVCAIMAAWVAWGRWKKAPIAAR